MCTKYKKNTKQFSKLVVTQKPCRQVPTVFWATYICECFEYPLANDEGEHSDEPCILEDCSHRIITSHRRG